MNVCGTGRSWEGEDGAERTRMGQEEGRAGGAMLEVEEGRGGVRRGRERAGWTHTVQESRPLDHVSVQDIAAEGRDGAASGQRDGAGRPRETKLLGACGYNSDED